MASTPTVLLVDDQPDLLELYTSWLDDEYDVVTSATGQEALQVVDERVDVVLLDRRMPECSGDDVLERIRDDGLRCRVGMVTAVDPDFDILDMGFDTYVVKPTTEEELLETVEMLLNLRTYDDQLQRCFRLASKKSALEERKSYEELRRNEEYGRLEDELARLREDVVDTFANLDEDGFEAAFRELVDPTHPPAPGQPGRS